MRLLGQRIDFEDDEQFIFFVSVRTTWDDRILMDLQVEGHIFEYQQTENCSCGNLLCM
jgi:acetone carboxylase gamma subunit